MVGGVLRQLFSRGPVVRKCFSLRNQSPRKLLEIPALVLVFGSVLLASGCAHVGYYSQAVGGHLKLMHSRQSIDTLLADDTTDEQLRDKLQTLVDARRFAVQNLLLPDNDSYTTYVETGRDAVTWNVVATDEFSVQARTWCFPVAGCVSYRGYFDKADAEAYADELARQSLDVIIGGASAYSTLGWFADPVLDTMLRGSDIRYVGTLFHELAHQLVYIKDDSNFNEAYATFVEQIGVRRWLEHRDEADRIAYYDASLARSEDFSGLLKSTRQALQTLYASDLAESDMRRQKEAVFEQMRADYEQLKINWDGYSGYDNWFRRDLNNARLVAVATYRRYVPAFYALYEEAGQDLERFYQIAREVADMEKGARTERLEQLL